jgi:hypothetical protein
VHIQVDDNGSYHIHQILYESINTLKRVLFWDRGIAYMLHMSNNKTLCNIPLSCYLLAMSSNVSSRHSTISHAFRTFDDYTIIKASKYLSLHIIIKDLNILLRGI